MRCKTCHYSLDNLGAAKHRCPECGRPFDPKDPRTFAGEPSMLRRMTRHLLIAGAVFLIVCAIFAAVLYWLLHSVLGGDYW